LISLKNELIAKESRKMISENFSNAIEKINNNDTSGLQELIKSRDVEIDDEDEHGMTLLQHAAFKGKKDICQLLLDLVSLTMFNVSMLLI
jgi:ankyrin repeat protein